MRLGWGTARPRLTRSLDGILGLTPRGAIANGPLAEILYIWSPKVKRRKAGWQGAVGRPGDPAGRIRLSAVDRRRNAHSSIFQGDASGQHEARQDRGAVAG